MNPPLAQKLAHTAFVMESLVVDAPVRARPVVPSAVHPTSAHPDGRGVCGDTKLGVDGDGLQVGFGSVLFQSRLHPGSVVRAPVKPTGSSGMDISGLQALEKSWSTYASSIGQSAVRRRT